MSISQEFAFNEEEDLSALFFDPYSPTVQRTDSVKRDNIPIRNFRRTFLQVRNGSGMRPLTLNYFHINPLVDSSINLLNFSLELNSISAFV